MGIQSTMDITREDAIERIIKVEYLAFHKKCKDLEDNTFEPDYSVDSFIDKFHQRLSLGVLVETDLTQYTDSMLEKVMDKPFYRYSMFDNYMIVEE